MIIKITGMTCGHCVSSVESALRHVPGVKEIKEIRLKDGIAIIEGDPNLDEISAAVRDAGYSVSIV